MRLFGGIGYVLAPSSNLNCEHTKRDGGWHQDTWHNQFHHYGQLGYDGRLSKQWRRYRKPPYHGTRHILIQNNTVVGPTRGYDGDAISSDTPPNTIVRILGNTIGKCSIGIDVNFSNGTVQNNTITECTTCLHKGGSGNTYGGQPCDGNFIP